MHPTLTYMSCLEYFHSLVVMFLHLPIPTLKAGTVNTGYLHCVAVHCVMLMTSSGVHKTCCQLRFEEAGAAQAYYLLGFLNVSTSS